MGLDFSHGSAHWSYSGFNRFRVKIARLADLDSYARIMEGLLDEEFEIPDEHPLEPFLNHSDCAGFLTVEQMKVVEPALRALVESMPSSANNAYDRENGIELCDAMLGAIADGEPLAFQ